MSDSFPTMLHRDREGDPPWMGKNPATQDERAKAQREEIEAARKAAEEAMPGVALRLCAHPDLCALARTGADGALRLCDTLWVPDSHVGGRGFVFEPDVPAEPAAVFFDRHALFTDHSHPAAKMTKAEFITYLKPYRVIYGEAALLKIRINKACLAAMKWTAMQDGRSIWTDNPSRTFPHLQGCPVVRDETVPAYPGFVAEPITAAERERLFTASLEEAKAADGEWFPDPAE